MKIMLPLLSFMLFNLHGMTQQTVRIENQLLDTTNHTVLEDRLRQKNVTQKMELTGNVNISGIYFSNMVVQNLRTGEITKGLFVSNQSFPNPSIFNPGTERHAFIDESEVDSVLAFFENCHSVWKEQRPGKITTYVYETKDKLRFEFSAPSDSQGWRFSIVFGRYYYYYADTMGKGRSGELFSVIKNLVQSLREK